MPVTSRYEVARRAGVRMATLREWFAAGLLPERGPWTVRQIREAEFRARGGIRRGPRKGHGTYARWRYGCHCDDCCAARRALHNKYRQAAAVARWKVLGPQLCELLAAGARYRDAAVQVGATTREVAAYRRRDPAFAERLDAALTAGRDPNLVHGGGPGWQAGCRCPECRAYHEAHR
ncbi:hypothetical protein ACAG26_08530 [Mycobacterium sp. pUA109]|uniref:hypothetical protein n=1 Tax=Mycobacterium sp. pUA109 TaxID=3238982 RepID=UPI00351B7050